MGEKECAKEAAAHSVVMAGLVPAIHVVRHPERGVDARAFAAPKRRRPRRRDKPGHDAW